MSSSSIAPLYRGWEIANSRLIERVRPLTPGQLALPIGSPTWPIWASVSHLAGTRVYWLCHVFGEPGAETTPFTDAANGWEDDLSHPRDADELVGALEVTRRIVARTLDKWTPESLTQEARRVRADGQVQMHTRQSVLYRMVTHDAYHIGEISLILGSHGLGEIDIWGGLARVVS
jgi:uncharacterized damage-inducible protein DinB